MCPAAMAAGKRLQVTADVIIHATEDKDALLLRINDLLGTNQANDFHMVQTVGCFENPIMVANKKITGKHATDFARRLMGALSRRQADELVGGIHDRVDGSRLYMRLGKQELMDRRIVMGGRDDDDNDSHDAHALGGSVRIMMHIQAYRRKDVALLFAEVLEKACKVTDRPCLDGHPSDEPLNHTSRGK